MIGRDGLKTGRPKKGSYREGRKRKFCIRVSEETLDILNFLSSYYGITKSDLIAQLVEDERKKIERR